QGARVLTDSPALDSLSELSVGKLGRWCIPAEDVSDLFASVRLTNLRRVRLRSNYVGGALAATLADRSHFRQLDELELICTSLQPREFAVLVASPKVERLRLLNLQGNGLGDTGVRALVQSGLRSLEELNLRFNGLTAESARLLAAWPGLRSVRVLQLG